MLIWWRDGGGCGAPALETALTFCGWGRPAPSPDSDSSAQAIIGECVFVSEAFFPFADSIEAAHEMGAKYIVQPGGSIRDDEVIAACNKYGIAMAFTGMRHFKH